MSLTALKPQRRIPSGLSPAETRRARQREDARRAILDATEALLLEEGESFGVRALAARCGYTAPTIYHYFGDKDGLIDALLEERFAQLLAEVRRAKPTDDDPVENLRAMVRAYVRFGQRNPAFYRVLLAARSDGADRSPPAVEAAVAEMMQPWETLQAAGRLGDITPDAASQALWGLLHGLTALRVARPDHEWAPRLTDIAVDAMLRGLVRDDAPARPAPARARRGKARS